MWKQEKKNHARPLPKEEEAKPLKNKNTLEIFTAVLIHMTIYAIRKQAISTERKDS